MRDNSTDRLREWAAGQNNLVAAVELLARSFGGRFASSSMPWVRDDTEHGGPWVDPATLRERLGAFSGGEARVLLLAASLLDEEPINIVDIVAGVDRYNLTLVLAALSHAGDSQESTEIVATDVAVAVVSRGPVLDWPAASPGPL